MWQHTPQPFYELGKHSHHPDCHHASRGWGPALRAWWDLNLELSVPQVSALTMQPRWTTQNVNLLTRVKLALTTISDSCAICLRNWFVISVVLQVLDHCAPLYVKKPIVQRDHTLLSFLWTEGQSAWSLGELKHACPCPMREPPIQISGQTFNSDEQVG